MKLAFKNWSFGFTEKEVPIQLKLGTLDDTCKALGIEFHEITETIKNTNYDFSVELLYQGHLTACAEKFKAGRWTRRDKKYSRTNAVIWFEYMSQASRAEYAKMMNDLFGELSNVPDKKKVTQDTN